MFNIQFQGLMTHATVGDGSGGMQELTVIYNVPHVRHDAVLTANISELKTGTSAAVIGNGEGVVCYGLSGLVTVDLPLGPVTKPVVGVPSLRSLCNGTVVRPEIINRTGHPDFAAIIVLPSGTLTIRDWYPYKGHIGAGSPECFPRTLVLAMNATSDVTFKIGNDKVIVSKDATVLISNSPHDPHAMAHGDVQMNFYSDATTIDLQAESPTQPCTNENKTAMKSCTTFHHLSVDCSNTIYP